jgi:hypothetical protein
MELRPLYSESYTAPVKPGLAFMVYSNTKPHHLKISSLQKGLILVHNGRELIEEGAGFGVPAAIFSDKTYFSGSAHTFIGECEQSTVIVKRFLLDMVARRRWRITSFVDNPFYKSVSRLFENTYINYPNSRKAIIPLIAFKNKVGVKTDFIKSVTRGEIIVTYRIKQDRLEIEADLAGLNRAGLKKLVFLNEQGTTFFRRLKKPGSSDLIDEEIGAWNLISASHASFSDLENSLTFSLQNLPKSRLFVGREYFKGLTAWAGMEYEVEPPLDQFSYRIQFSFGGDRHD